AQALIDLLQANSQSPLETRIRYQDGKRTVAFWREVEADEHVERLPWKDGGIYLITGGTGGLGMLFVGEIARCVHGATVILVGRSAPGIEQQTRLQELEATTGTRILYKPVDVADRQAVAGLVQTIREEFGGLHGIIHSAGVLRDTFL